MSKALANLGVQRGMVVYGKDGLDEISVSAPTAVCEIQDGQLTTYEITPEEFGLERCQKEDLAGGTAEDNAQITKAILSGEKGPKRNAVLLNSAAAIHIARPFISIKEAIKMAEELIDSGKAMEQLEAFVKLTNEE